MAYFPNFIVTSSSTIFGFSSTCPFSHANSRCSLLDRTCGEEYNKNSPRLGEHFCLDPSRNPDTQSVCHVYLSPPSTNECLDEWEPESAPRSKHYEPHYEQEPVADSLQNLCK